MSVRCPGQDQRYWKPEDIFDIQCPYCDHEIEFWKDEPMRFCPSCEKEIRNPKIDLGCAKWCKFADSCVGKLAEDIRNIDADIKQLQNGTFYHFRNRNDLFKKAVGFFEMLMTSSLEQNGRFIVLLSGGSTPKKLFELIVKMNSHHPLDWSNVHFFWGDDRCVEPESELSNYGAANELLFKKLKISQSNIHRIEGELGPVEAAKNYEKKIVDFFDLSEGEIPEFDLAIQGMGNDGHTASIFPGTDQIEQKGIAIPIDAPEKIKPSVPRVSLTMDVLNNSKNVLFLACGKEKIDLVDKFLKDKGLADELPAAKVVSKGETSWYLGE